MWRNLRATENLYIDSSFLGVLNSVFESSPVQRKVINLINLLCKCVNKFNLNIVLKSAEKSAMLSSHGSGFRTLL